MQTQNTPVHVKLWHHDFWQLSIANLLLTMSVYMLLPVLPQMISAEATPLYAAAYMGSYGAGLFLLGGFCSFLVQRYRRNVVCILSITAMVACFGSMYYLPRIVPGDALLALVLARLALGATFGLTQVILMSTLIIDTCESFQRTEANHASAWFGRFAISLGPVASFAVYRSHGFDGVLVTAAICCLMSLVLIRLVKFPFKAPCDNMTIFSCDRFFLPQGIWLFINLALTGVAMGMMFTLEHSPMFYGMVMVGFFMALLSQRFVFVNADLKSEAVTGFILIGAAMLMMRTNQIVAVTYISPALIGLGIGIVASRFQMFFIKLSRHCQRGTSQSTYILAWESGISAGLALGYALFSSRPAYIPVAALAVTVAALAMYCLFTHSWYIKNKNR